jgi:hypothetical protein
MPADKPFDVEDPMELVAVTLPAGNAREALDGLVVEYLMLGWSRSQISFIFESPHYAGLRWITREIGAERVRARVRELCDQWSNAWIAGGTSDAAGL